ncbi:MAG: FecR family protein [Niastella sp.]|uniref:FecR family protein n=1 Tax=Niastella sp. TaxID=1869183 RepID=UPI00389ADA26
MKDNSIINGIIIKVITGEALTSTESTMYSAYMADEGNRRFVEEFKNDAYLLQKLKEIHAIDVAGGKAIIEEELKRNYGKQVDIKRPRKLFRDVATSAAAVLFILTAAYFFWWYSKRDKAIEVKEEVKTIAQKAIGPAQRIASLTLADGSRILLDSAKAGQLAQQGGAVVMNENGALKYQTRSAAREILFNTLTTAYAQTYSMELADGSKAWLNAGASIRYPVEFSGNERKVEITGEVYFEVAHDATKPFIVHVSGKKGSMDVQVLGTHFNINAYDDEPVMKTTLLEGSVKVTKDAASVLLKPGEQTSVSPSSQPSHPIPVQTEAVVAWKNGVFSFDNADIDVVMRQLIKWYDIEVVYDGDKPSDKISGEMQRNLTLPQVAENLEFMTGLHFRVEGRKLIVPAASPNDSRKNDK